MKNCRFMGSGQWLHRTSSMDFLPSKKALKYHYLGKNNKENIQLKLFFPLKSYIIKNRKNSFFTKNITVPESNRITFITNFFFTKFTTASESNQVTI